MYHQPGTTFAHMWTNGDSCLNLWGMARGASGVTRFVWESDNVGRKLGALFCTLYQARKCTLKEPVFSKESKSPTTVCSRKGDAYRILQWLWPCSPTLCDGNTIGMCFKNCVLTFLESDQNSNKSGYDMITLRDPVGRTLLPCIQRHPKDFVILFTVLTLRHMTSGCSVFRREPYVAYFCPQDPHGNFFGGV